MKRYEYPRMMVEALRQVMRDALRETAELGLEGDHHFAIEIATQHPGVVMPPFLRDLYPELLVIVLQHQFWDLEVDDEGFAVTLSFSGVKNHLAIPFAAVEAFSDPGAGFGLRFALPPEETEVDEPPPRPELVPPLEAAPPSTGGSVVQFDRKRKK